MCGRVSLLANPELLLQLFGVDGVPDQGPQFNTAPTDPVLAIRERKGERQAEWMRWGLVPSWAKDPKIGARMINARSETVATKSAFRSAFTKRRCLIAVDGFYEWERQGKTKLPWRFVMDADLATEPPFALAGLWEPWKQPDGEWLITATILTTTANALVERIHDRMPVILEPGDFETWLDPAMSERDTLAGMLVPYPAERMAMVRVSAHVNNARHKDAACVVPLAGDAAARIRGRDL